MTQWIEHFGLDIIASYPRQSIPYIKDAGKVFSLGSYDCLTQKNLYKFSVFLMLGNESPESRAKSPTHLKSLMLFIFWLDLITLSTDIIVSVLYI